ncbi:hypothetical protein Pmani_005364 [Petrolisthes manimaculis]|uniref:Uncharacterized protein n=1 Tax=Petrolisthes manimaculis TaxID=1843537 RepID=A0AAE1UHJ4_9EUCA|nr:hypothetical protein Pmani_005364 [Petrolisthes manimaculis]
MDATSCEAALYHCANQGLYSNYGDQEATTTQTFQTQTRSVQEEPLKRVGGGGGGGGGRGGRRLRGACGLGALLGLVCGRPIHEDTEDLGLLESTTSEDSQVLAEKNGVNVVLLWLRRQMGDKTKEKAKKVGWWFVEGLSGYANIYNPTVKLYTTTDLLQTPYYA